MITKILEWIAIFSIILLILAWTPTVQEYPMPGWLTSNISNFFIYMKLFLDFPVVSTAYTLGYMFFIYIWLPIQAYNLVLKFLGVFPSLEHLSRFQIK